MRSAVLFLSILVHLSLQDCSWNNCNQWSSDPNVLNVHLVTHTHDDMGWLKTVDQYFWGSKQDIVDVGVQYIYDTVIAELEKDPDRRFSFAETGFFYRWWITNTPADQQRLVKLVMNGQVEWIGGGWTQNDEAAEHYVDTIDQMTYGLKKLQQFFGDCGKAQVAWQIDPFGHSREMANLFSQIGYNALFFARIHYLDKKQRLANKTLEFNWSGSDDYNSNLLTGAFYQDNYNPPEGFCFDLRCRDDPIMDNPNLEGYNLNTKVEAFLKHVTEQSEHQATNHILLTMGSDFHYANANEVFRNLDRLIKAINSDPNNNVTVFYSTPSCYVKGLQESNVQWTTKTDDFFPYADTTVSFWTGYFTSRPTFKGMIREASSLLQLAKRLDALGNLDKTTDDNIDTMTRASALCQHHDAVTGTAKQAVSYDYYKHLDIAFKASDPVVNVFLASTMTQDANFPAPEHTMCHTINETVCTVIKNVENFAVTVFNPSGQDITTVITIPFYQNQANVTDNTGNELDYQISKTFKLPLADHGTMNIAPFELSFTVTVPALGYNTYLVDASVVHAVKEVDDYVDEEDPAVNGTSIENEFLVLNFGSDGYLNSYTEKSTGLTHSFRQQFFFYRGIESPNPQPSGAYIFRPVKQTPDEINDAIAIEKVTGSQRQEIRQIVSDWVYQTVRLKAGSPAVEFEWTVGPIPKEVLPQIAITKEVVTRYITDIKSENVFFTDANGRQMMRRKVNEYPSFTYRDTEPTSGNYYPITNRIFINDPSRQMTVLTDRAQGGSSRNGMIEIMVHRRTFSDDHRGVGEPLDEPGVDGKGLIVKGTHHILLTNTTGAADIHRPSAVQKFNKPVLAFAPLTNQADFVKNNNLWFSGLATALPPSVNLLSLEHWDSNHILVRLENIMQKSEGGQTQTVDIFNLFSTIQVNGVKELKLGANRDRTDVNWTGSNAPVTLDPQEIRTFIIQTSPTAATSTAAAPPNTDTTVAAVTNASVPTVQPTTPKPASVLPLLMSYLLVIIFV